MKLATAFAAALLFASAAGARGLDMAITVDDLPVHGSLPPGETRLGVARQMLAAMKGARVPQAYGFANGSHLEREPESEAVLSAWRSAGYPLGNHTWSHQNLNDLAAEEYQTDIVRNEPLLRAHSRGKNWRWFRYPFLSEGSKPGKRAEVRRFLSRNRYRIAGVTMTFWDYEWNDAYVRCMTAGDAAAVARIESAYLDAVKRSIDHWRRIAWAAYGRDIPYVLLTHVSALNARMFPRILALYRQTGFRFTTLSSAQRHPAYRADTDPSVQPAVGIERRAVDRGLASNARYDPRPLLEGICAPPR